MTKAVLLLSGGLDSTLAGKLLLEQGIEVEAINFVSPFCLCTPKGWGCSAARLAADQLGIPVKVYSCGEDYLEMVKHPRFGRGQGMNPCLDCRIYIFRRAKKHMEDSGADFIATGEVLGERPMSQRREAMELIEREAGLEGLVVRPLSAGLLKPSRAEEEGKVDRSRLAAIRGRRRAPQMELARKLGITDYLCPAGGCLLTDPEFAARVKDLFAHEPECKLSDVRLLKAGRHYRLPSGEKAVAGRNQEDNKRIESMARQGDILLIPRSRPGPTVLVRGKSPEEAVDLAAGLMLHHMKKGEPVETLLKIIPDREETRVFSTALEPEAAKRLLVCRENVPLKHKSPKSGKSAG